MQPMLLSTIAEVAGGRLTDTHDPEALVFEPAVFDSREAKPGSLFIALAGNARDGHDYAQQAAANGAVAALVTRPVGVPESSLVA